MMGMIFVISCTSQDDPPFGCHSGTILGRIRGAGGGVAVSLDDTSFGNHSWHSASNVVEALHVPDSLWVNGLRIYFIARHATEAEAAFPKSADGNESDKPLIFVTAYSLTNCSSINRN